MPNHTVAQGECFSSIAAQFGFTVDTLWNLPENAQLKANRKDPNVLYPDDVVFVPDPRPKEVSCATEKRHPFVKKGSPAKLKIRLLDGQQPRANVAYKLQIDGVWVDGTTDSNGYLEQPLPPSAKKGQLLVGEGPTQDVHDLDFGFVDPIETDSGVAKRLRDLGYETGSDPSIAIRGFQADQGLEVTGQVDDAFKQKLSEVFGQ
jgi:N-acetylmuramoyl-L-alanine amidase